MPLSWPLSDLFFFTILLRYHDTIEKWFLLQVNFSTLKRVVKRQGSCHLLSASIYTKLEKVKCKCIKEHYGY